MGPGGWASEWLCEHPPAVSPGDTFDGDGGRAVCAGSGFSNSFPGAGGYERLLPYVQQMAAPDLQKVMAIANDVMDRVNFMKQQGGNYLLQQLPFLQQNP